MTLTLMSFANHLNIFITNLKRSQHDLIVPSGGSIKMFRMEMFSNIKLNDRTETFCNRSGNYSVRIVKKTKFQYILEVGDVFF